MSIHIGAKKGEIAKTVLMPGDPLRAKFIAETFLKDAKCYNEVRGMYGFTGTYEGVAVSVQGSGMGVPSIGIYAHELIHEYDVQNLIRVGTCGSLQAKCGIRDVILGSAVSTTSAINKNRFRGMDFAPTADFDLLLTAYETAKEMGKTVHVGNILCADLFYDETAAHKMFQEFGALAVEMECTALYTEAAKTDRRALGILTVSDSLVTGEATSAEERQSTFKDMMEIALKTAVKIDRL